MRDPAIAALCAELAEPFDGADVKWKPQQVKNNRCMAICYIDARHVEERLDDVIGNENWEDAYEVLHDGSVVCRLTIHFPGKSITKCDVGSPSEQPDAGDRLKAAFSDALKRAAVKFGIARYLYRLAHSWVDYDTVKKQIAQVPKLPAWALPKKPAAAAPQPAPPKAAETAKPAADLPATGAELQRRVREYDAKLSSQKLCPVGGLMAHLTQAGVKAGYSADMTLWTGPAIPFAVSIVKEFEEKARSQAK